MSKKQELIKNTLIMAMGSIPVQFASFLLLPFYTTHLSTGDFGVVDLVTTYNFLLVPIISMQLSMAAFRFLVDARGDERAKKSIVSNVLLGASTPAAISIALFLLIEQFVRIPYAYWGLATIVAGIVPTIFLQFARGFGKNTMFAVASAVSGVATVVLNVILIGAFHMGARGMLTSSVVASLASSVYLFFALKLYRYINFSVGDKLLRKKLLHYALPLIPSGISWWVINAADRTIISTILGISSNGIYAVAYKFPTLLGSTFWFFSMSWTESASMHIGLEDRDKFFSEVSNATVRFFGSLAAVMVAYIGLFFNILIGHAFRPSYEYIPILVMAAFFGCIVDLYSGLYVAKKLTKQVANSSIFAAIINITLSIVSIKFIGMYGTALATVVAYLVMAIYRHYDTKKYIKLTYEKYVFLKVGLLFALASGLYYYNNPLLNIYSAVAVGIIAIVLNRAIVSVMKERVLSSLKKLTPDQEVAEEVI